MDNKRKQNLHKDQSENTTKGKYSSQESSSKKLDRGCSCGSKVNSKPSSLSDSYKARSWGTEGYKNEGPRSENYDVDIISSDEPRAETLRYNREDDFED